MEVVESIDAIYDQILYDVTTMTDSFFRCSCYREAVLCYNFHWEYSLDCCLFLPHGLVG